MSHSKCHHVCSLAILCGLALSAGAFAENHPKENAADAHFKAMDANGDGKLSPDEHAAGAKKMFDTMDANKDGTVTSSEMDAAHEKVAGEKATKADMSSAEKIKVVDTNGRRNADRPRTCRRLEEDVRQDGHRQGWFRQQGQARDGSREDDEKRS